MNKIGETIIEDGITTKPTKSRNTVRGIIICKNKVVMLYSKMFNDYTFPGGGIKDDENHSDALRRELAEELGAFNVEIIKPIGYTTEIRYGINSTNNVYEQNSYFYLVEAKSFAKPKYIGREKEQGLKMVKIKANKAINHNNKMYEVRAKNDEKGFKTVLMRENTVLKYLIDNYEKI